MSGFASTLGSPKKHAEAEEMLRELIAKQQQLLGPEHPRTLLNTINLAATLSDQNKHDEALIIQRASYSGHVKVQGAMLPMHPTTLLAASNLAVTLKNLGEYSECEAIYREALVMQMKVLGAAHDHTKRTAHNLQCLIDRGHASTQTLP